MKVKIRNSSVLRPHSAVIYHQKTTTRLIQTLLQQVTANPTYLAIWWNIAARRTSSKPGFKSNAPMNMCAMKVYLRVRLLTNPQMTWSIVWQKNSETQETVKNQILHLAVAALQAPKWTADTKQITMFLWTTQNITEVKKSEVSPNKKAWPFFDRSNRNRTKN